MHFQVLILTSSKSGKSKKSYWQAKVCVLIAVNNWVIGLTGNWYSISVIFLTIGIFNLEQAVQYFGPYYSAI